MIHLLRWIAILGTPVLIWWLYQPQPKVYRYKSNRTFN